MKSKTDQDNSTRLKEIREVLSRNKITRGVSPEKLRIILEELGPTYIKLGQIMSLHSDILPKRYCDELMKLTSDVTPMPFSDVEEVLNDSLGCPWKEYFTSIDDKPLGSASIAQVHKAKLRAAVCSGSTGDADDACSLASGDSGDLDVIIKVQRKGIYETMSRDIVLFHKAVRFLPPVGDLKNLVDLDMVLDEMWSVAQEEMDFRKEESNMDEFARNNKDIKYVRCPKLYRRFSTNHILVMEYIGGCEINDVAALRAGGYDLDEIGQKFVNSFIKQVMEDGFFHADPHPGNVKIADGRIVWIDMGMMGRLTDRDRKIMVRGVKGIALHDIDEVENAVLDLGDFKGKPDRKKLYVDLKGFLQEYGSASMGSINVPDSMQALMDIMKDNKISLPHGMTMLCRGLTHVQGVLAVISPDINMAEIASARITENAMEDYDWKAEIKRDGRHIYRSLHKSIEIPSLTTDIMREYLAGHGQINMTLHSSQGLSELIYASVRNLVIGLCIAALLIGSSIVCTTDMKPQIYGMPLLGVVGFVFALAASGFLVLRYIIHKIMKK